MDGPSKYCDQKIQLEGGSVLFGKTKKNSRQTHIWFSSESRRWKVKPRQPEGQKKHVVRILPKIRGHFAEKVLNEYDHKRSKSKELKADWFKPF